MTEDQKDILAIVLLAVASCLMFGFSAVLFMQAFK